MNRRSFFGSLLGLAASLTVDPEKLIWVPGAKTIFIPPATHEPLYDEITATTLEEIRKNIVFNNFFVATPVQRKLRSWERHWDFA